jgi:hypothetical protein
MHLKIARRHPPVTPPVRPAGLWRRTLDAGARLLQTATPLKSFDVYVVGFHCAKGRPDEQMEAHHYCRIVGEDMLQCALFDGNTADANLIGVEYIVAEALFEEFPQDEKDYWHPHNFEILSGQLVAPGLPDRAEKALMKLLVNSYGKTWHTWHTGRQEGEPGMELPYGDPKLMWSFNREGECDPALARRRDEAMAIDTRSKATDRQDFLALTHPQHGVDAMANDFPAATPVPGVTDADRSP